MISLDHIISPVGTAKSSSLFISRPGNIESIRIAREIVK